MTAFPRVRARLVGTLAAMLLCLLLLGFGVTQEVPMGHVQGRVVMAENGRPLPDTLVTLSPLTAEDREIVRARSAMTKPDGSFAIRNLPAGSYEVAVSSRHHESRLRYVWIDEGTTKDFGELRLSPTEPYLNLYGSQRVFTPDEEPYIHMNGFTDRDSVTVQIARLDVTHLARLGGLNALHDMNRAEKLPSDAVTGLQTLRHRISKRDIEGAFNEPVKVPKLQEGLYLVRCTTGDLRAGVYLNITRIGMVTKASEGQALAFVTDLVSGVPQSGVDVLALRNGRLTRIGQTDSEGLCQLPSAGSTVLLGKRGTSIAMVGFNGEASGDPAVRVAVYTDRPVYRPGDTIHYKGIVRRRTEDGLEVVRGGSAVVELREQYDESVVRTQKVAVSENGTLHGSFDTATEDEPGEWQIAVKAAGGLGAAYVPIEEYRKPDYTVKVTPTQPFFIAGGRASAEVRCEYYFGGPVVGARVRATVYRSPDYGWFGDEEALDEEEPYEPYLGGEYTQSIEAVTDEQGVARIEFDTRAEGDPSRYPVDYLYTVSASVADSGGRFFDGAGDVRVVRGAFDLSVEPDRYVLSPNETVALTVRAQSHDGKPVAGRPVTVVVGYEEWNRRRMVFVPIQTLRAVTGPDGTAALQTTIPRAGSVRFEATAKDDGGRIVMSDGYAWVAGDSTAWSPDRGDFQLTLDRKAYDPGDKARVLLQVEEPGGSALVTVESERVRWRKVVPLAQSNTLIEIPVEGAYAPNVFVTASRIHDKSFTSAERRLVVRRPDRKLTLEVIPSAEIYAPGDMAEVEIRAKDEQGRPAPAEVSLGVVDEAIYAIREDRTRLDQELYPHRYNEVRTVYSFPDVYLDGGDKGAPEIPPRWDFKDTAHWRPVVSIPPSGVTKVAFKLPDNLTQWRATVLGISAQNAVGKGVAKFRSRKALMIRLTPPMYLVQGDRQRMAAIVTNDSGRDQQVHVEVLVGGHVGERRTLRIGQGKSETVDVQIEGGATDPLVLLGRAWIAGAETDAVEHKLVVHPHGRPVVTARAGDVPANGSAVETVTRLSDAASSKESLTVTVSPSVASSLVESLPELIGFPYGCTEQTMNRFLPTVLVSKALRDVGVSMPEIERQIPAMVQSGFQRLSTLQRTDGAWGWWEGGEPDAFMTALVLDGLASAKAAGYPPKQVNLERALERAALLANQPPVEPYRRRSWGRDRMYLVYALARHGRPEAAKKVLNGRFSLREMGAAELALLALTAAQLGKDYDGLKNAALVRLGEIANVGDLTISWSPEDDAFGAEPTALALKAYLVGAPGAPGMDKIVRHLMAVRKGRIWTSTRDTAYAIDALSTYVSRNKGQLAGARDVTIELNGEVVGQSRLSAQSASGTQIRLPLSRLRVGPNEIKILSQGGPSMYTVELRQVQREAVLPALPAKGLSVERKFYALAPQRTQDGSMRLLPSGRPIERVGAGELVRVEITVRTDTPREFVILEDPVPSNFHITERESFGPDAYWGWWWDKTVVRDDRIAFFVRWMKAGEHRFAYTMRAENPGLCAALPTRIENMYDPTQSASGAGQRLEVVR